MSGELIDRLKPSNSENRGRRLRGAPVLDRVMFRTLEVDGCWLWAGAITGKGYGHIRGDGGSNAVLVHRVVYEAVYGAIPEGLEIDHLCYQPRCVRPEHLEAVTHQENVRRKRPKTHCKRGHDLADAYLNSGRRHCRLCGLERAREARRAKR